VHAQAPEWFSHRAGRRHRKALAKAGWDAKSVDLWEVNEAFAAVTMAAMASSSCRTRSSTCTAAPARWATRSAPAGARIVVTLLGALRKRGLKRGVASLCIGGGEATALAVEML
jgi:acetyl-CoA C-acetyltransferase